MSRVPTRKQFGRLLALGSGATVLAGKRGEWEPLRRHGWTEDAPGFGDREPSRRFIYPQRITPAGLRALADALERYEAGEGER